MNAKAIHKAKLPSYPKTAALAHAPACSYLPTSFRAGYGSNLDIASGLARQTMTSLDHNCLREIGRTLVENSEHRDHIDAQDMKRPAKGIGMAQPEPELAERVKELKQCSTGGRLGATWNYVRTARSSRDGARAKETHCYAHI